MSFISDKFKNLIEYKSGYTWSKDQESSIFQNSVVRVLTVTNIQEKLDLRSELYLTQVNERDREKKAASKGWSIAVSSNGNRKRIGNAVFIEDDTDYLFASFLTGFIPKDQNRILPKYFFYWLSSHPVQERITSVSEGTTGLGNLDIRFLRNMIIYYPQELLKQKVIAEILSKVDDAIEAVENSIKTSELLKKSLMQNLITGKLKPDGTWRSDDEFYVDKKFGKVPKGWEVKKLKDLILFHQYGMNVASSDNGTVPMFRMNNIVDGKIVDEPMVRVDISNNEFKKYRVEKGDILFNRTNSMDLVGKIGIFDMDGDYVFASYLIRIRSTEDNVPEYLNYYLNSYRGQTSLRAKATPAVSQANINAKSLVQTYVPRPPKETQTDIVRIIKFQESAQVILINKRNTLKILKKSLMQHLLTGKVRVDVEKINKLLEEGGING
jgi:type I restriction enzyme S subunit